MPPTRITRGARAAPKPKGPVFPIRKPKLVTAADANVIPVNASKIKPHRTRHGWLMWGIMGLCAVLGVFFSQQVIAAYNWVRIETNERAYAEVGQDMCLMPILTVQERNCENCFSTDQELLLERYEAQARGFNKWRAERCLPLM
jgi:hypothetical protein